MAPLPWPIEPETLHHISDGYDMKRDTQYASGLYTLPFSGPAFAPLPAASVSNGVFQDRYGPLTYHVHRRIDSSNTQA